MMALAFLKCSYKSETPVNEVKKCWCADTSRVDSLKPNPPFDRALKIISYYYNDTSAFGHGPDFPATILHNHLNRKNILKEIDISAYRLELEKILFNKIINCEPGKSHLIQDSASSCIYFPHHCLVFYNKNNEATDYLEICFICDESEQSADFGPMCGQTFCELKTLFKKVGHEPSSLNIDKCR